MDRDIPDSGSLAERIARFNAMRDEVEKLRTELTPQMIREVVNLTEQIPLLKIRSGALAAGDLRLLSRITNAGGVRLREAIGRSILKEKAEPGDPIHIVVLLWTDPSAEDAAKLKLMGLEPVFAQGRWRPAAMYTGQARPEDVEELVLRYGGDCRQTEKPRQKRKREEERTA
jgi:hypothetical protein